MEFIEEHDLLKIHFLNSLSLIQFKSLCCKKCKNEEERKIKYNLMKDYCKAIIKTRGQIKKIYAYSLSTPLESGGRLYCGYSIQSLPKEIRGFLMTHTTDIDMKNCHPVILKYICKIHNLKCPNLEYYINHRDVVLSQFENRDAGKEAFLKAVNDNKLNTKIKDKFFKKFDIEMKSLQNIITNLEEYKEIHSSVPEDKKYNWNGSTINRILCMYENKILQIALSFSNRFGHKIAAPMFDGYMPYGNFYGNTELLQQLYEEVESNYNGLNMVWDYKEHDKTIVMPNDFVIPTKISNELKIANNDKEASTLVWEEQIKNVLVHSGGSFYYKKNNIWIQDYKIIEADIRNYVSHSNIYKLDSKGNEIDFSQNRKNADNIAKNIMDIAVNKSNDAWVNKLFSSSLGKILFNNGYYDFRKSKFYDCNDKAFDNSIIFTEKIPFDMKMNFNEKEYDYINGIRKRIFYTPFGIEVGDYYLLQLSRGLAGDCMKRFLFGIGSSNTGKSLISSALKSACGGYYGAYNGANLAYKPNSSSDEAQKLRWVKLLKTKRIITSNEIQMGMEIDGNMIKKVSNGGLDEIVARGHCQDETGFKIGFLPILFAQDMDNITPKDDAVINRIRAINYEKIYVDEPTNEYELLIDRNMDNEVLTYEFQVGFLMLLFQAYKVFQDGGRIETEPEGIKKAGIDILGRDISIIDKFKNDFEITQNEEDFVRSKDIEKWLGDGKFKVSITKFSLEMNKYINISKLKGVYNKNKKIKGKTSMVWFGIKMIEEEVE